jgi:hypothetical protein
MGVVFGKTDDKLRVRTGKIIPVVLCEGVLILKNK